MWSYKLEMNRISVTNGRHFELQWARALCGYFMEIMKACKQLALQVTLTFNMGKLKCSKS